MDIGIKLESHLSEVMGKMAEVARARMTEAVNEVRNTTLKTLSGPRSGRVYTVPGTSRKYTASAPGEPPAHRLGELAQHVSLAVEGAGADVAGYVGIASAAKNKEGASLGEIGTMLEYGTKKMAPRPWLRVSFEKAEGKVKEIFTRPWF